MKNVLNWFINHVLTHDSKVFLLKRQILKLNKTKTEVKAELDLRRKCSRITNDILDLKQTDKVLKGIIKDNKAEISNNTSFFPKKYQ